MMRWLDALGPLKWPSLLLIASPIAAYPFWLPAPAPAKPCGLVRVGERSFVTYLHEDGRYVLTPSTRTSGSAPRIQLGGVVGVEAGGIVATGLRGTATPNCASNPSAGDARR